MSESLTYYSGSTLSEVMMRQQQRLIEYHYMQAQQNMSYGPWSQQGNNTLGGLSGMLGYGAANTSAPRRIEGTYTAKAAPLDMKEPLLPYLRSRAKEWLADIRLK